MQQILAMEFSSIDWIRGFYVDLSVSADVVIFIIVVNVYRAKMNIKLRLTHKNGEQSG